MTDNGLLELLFVLSSFRHQPDGEPAFDLIHRPSLTRSFSWAIPNERALDTIDRCAGDHGVLEVGAGTGYWAGLLRLRGVDVVATDIAPPAPDLDRQHNLWHPAASTWTEVETVDATTAVERWGSRTLLYVWPPSISEMASESLASYRGDTLIYVGEWPTGVTGTPSFHRSLTDGWEIEERIEIPIWFRRSDALYVFRR